MIKPDWIAVDWGTTNLRVWAMSNENKPLEMRHSGEGMQGLGREDYEPALLALVEDWLHDEATVPVVCCGMVGSRQGWVEARYRAAPCKAVETAQNTPAPTKDKRIRVFVVPGIKQQNPADVMRGEETQIAGLLAKNPGFNGMICLPGTHSKWVRVQNGIILAFTTFMTGELFALLSEYSVLRHFLAAEGQQDAAFLKAVDSAIQSPAEVAAKLFSLRAESLLGPLDGAVARARLSGLLIGQEIVAMKEIWPRQSIAILGAGGLARLYHIALDHVGARSDCYDVESLTLAGCALALNRLECTA